MLSDGLLQPMTMHRLTWPGNVRQRCGWSAVPRQFKYKIPPRLRLGSRNEARSFRSPRCLIPVSSDSVLQDKVSPFNHLPSIASLATFPAVTAEATRVSRALRRTSAPSRPRSVLPILGLPVAGPFPPTSTAFPFACSREDF